MSENNQLQRVENNTTNSMMVVKNEPLLYYPDLKDTDIHKSTVLNDLEKQVLLATLNFPKIRSLSITRGEIGQPNTETYDALVDIIGLAIWTMGITENSMNKAEQKIFIPIAIEEIKTFPNLTIEDVRIAFNRGSRRKYGTMMNGVLSPTLQMSIATVNIWLTQYTEETKYDVMQRLQFVKPLELEQPKELTEEEKLKNHNNWLGYIYKKFEEFKATNKYDYYDFNNKFYSYLKKLGLVNLNEEQQEKIWNKAVKELKNEYHPKNGRNFGQRIDLKGIYDALKSDKVDEKQNDLIVARCKKLFIKYYFIRLIRDAKHLKDIIEDAEIKYATVNKSNEINQDSKTN
ncbi:MAG: hypothetical protein IPJ01_10970 [Micavibrio sp.]|nr:hypothetical protein [Micavibrio sp.]